MRFLYIVLFLFAFTGHLFSFSLQRNIPANSLYGAIKVQENISGLAYRILSPSLRDQFYPGGPNVSSIRTAILGLKTLDIQDVEFFTNDDWNILLKLNTKKITQVEELLIRILNQEGFMAQGKTISASSRIISSKNTELAGNNFYLQQEDDYTLVTPNKQALDAWKARKTKVRLYQEGTKKLKETPDAIGFLYDGMDYLYSSNHPSFVTVSTSDNLASLNVSIIRHEITPKPIIPTFFKDNPILFITSTENLSSSKVERLKNLFVPLTTFLPSFKLPLDVLLSPSSNIKGVSIEFVDGDLVSVNERKYDNLDFALGFQFPTSKAAKDLLTSYFRANPIFNFSTQASKTQETFILTPKLPNARDLGFFPIYFVLDNNGFLVLTLNKNTMHGIASNIAEGKKSLNIKNNNKRYSLYANIAQIIDRFPILNSLVSQQTGIDLKAFKEVEESAEYTAYGDNASESRAKITFSVNS